MCIDVSKSIDNTIKLFNKRAQFPMSGELAVSSIKVACKIMTINRDGYCPPQYLYEYGMQLHEWLTSAKCFAEFKQLISIEMNKLKLGDWSYARLDLPFKLTVSEHLGTINQDYTNQYITEAFYQCDLMLECAPQQTSPLFQSQFETFVEQTPYSSKEYKQYRQLLGMNKYHGYEDTYNIPIKSSFHNGPILFSTTSKNIEINQFRQYVSTNTELLRLIGQTIDNVGVLKFPEHFINAKLRHDEFTSSFPFNLISAVTSKDLNDHEAAEYFGRSIEEIQKTWSTIRNMWGTRTNLAAIYKAIDAGYFA